MTILEKKKRVQKAIPEGGTGMIETIRIFDPGIIAEMEFGLEIVHPFQGDLFVELTSPSGQSVVLHDRQGGSLDDLRKIYHSDIFGDFIGQPAIGAWRLKVVDPVPKDKGILESWRLTFVFQES